MADPAAEAAAWCLDQVRRGDHERYLTALFAPAAARADLLALYAFNLEIARTAEVASEPTLGLIRLQWWREAVAEGLDGAAHSHPVLRLLADLARRRPLARADFETLLAAREQDLASEPFADEAAFLAYAEASSVPLVRLALTALGAAPDAAGPAGLAWSVTGLLRALPHRARRRHLTLPRRLLEAHGVAAEDVFRGRPSPGLAAAVRQIAGHAEAQLAAARARPPDAAALPALLPATLAGLHLRRLARCGHDPFRLAAQPPPHLAAPLRLWWAARRGRL